MDVADEPEHAQELRAAVAQIAPELEVVGVTPLSTLPHSAVRRLTLSDDRTVIMKQAGAPEFAEWTAKELFVNRDVLANLGDSAAPRLLADDPDATLPWLILEDVSKSHRSLNLDLPPAYRYVEQFVAALAKVHARSTRVDLAELFANVPGDTWVTDGAEHVPAVLDEFLHGVDPGQFPAPTFDLIRAIRDNLSQLARLLSSEPVLLHGDAHFGNAMFSDDGALLLDWARAVIGPGEVDLCHGLGMNLPRFCSSHYELEAIRYYSERCGQYGRDVDESDVLSRYRQGMLLTVILAIGMQTVPGMPARTFSYMFTNAVHSAIDLDSQAFLG